MTRHIMSRVFRKAVALGSVAALTFCAFVAPSSGAISVSATVPGGVDYSTAANSGYRNVMYYGDWSIWGGQKNFMVKDIPGEYITHLNFAFLDFDAAGNLILCDPDADFGHPMGMGAPYGHSGVSGIVPAMQDLRAKYPNMRIGVSIGGWSKSKDFTPMAANDASRAAFIANVRQFLIDTNMDFVDIDWEYPGSKRDGDAVDNANDEGTPLAQANDGKLFVQLLTDLKNMENDLAAQTGRVYELSAALPSTAGGFENGGQAYLPAGKVKADGSFVGLGVSATQAELNDATTQYVKEMFEQLDFGNLMTYDMRGAFDTVTGHHAALYSHPEADLSDAAKAVNFSADALVAYLRGLSQDARGNVLQKQLNDLDAAPESKIVVGVAMYTRGWHEANADGIDTTESGTLFATTNATNTDTQGSSRGATPEAPMAAGDGGWATGVWSYGSMVALNAAYPGLQYYYDAVAEAPYLAKPNGGAFFTFDNPRSIEAKADYVKANGLGGLISWSISQDAPLSAATQDVPSTDTSAGSPRGALTKAEWQGLWNGSALTNFNIGEDAALANNVHVTITASANSNNANMKLVKFSITNSATASQSDGNNASANAAYMAAVVGSPVAYITLANGASMPSIGYGYPYGALIATQVGANKYKVELGSANYDWKTLDPGETIEFGFQINGGDDVAAVTQVEIGKKMYAVGGEEVATATIYTSAGAPPVVPTATPTVPPTTEPTVAPTTPPETGTGGVAEWNATTVYLQGDRVSYQGVIYEAKWWTQGDNPAAGGDANPWQVVVSAASSSVAAPVAPVEATAPDVVLAPPALASSVAAEVAQEAVAPPVLAAPPSTGSGTWDAAQIYEQGDQVIAANGLVYEARWWTQGVDPTTADAWGPWALVSSLAA